MPVGQPFLDTPPAYLIARRVGYEQFLAAHPAPGGDVRSCRRVVGKDLDHLAGFDLDDPSGQVNDGQRALQTEAVEPKDRFGHDTPTLDRSSATIGGRAARKLSTSVAEVVQASPIRTLP